MNLKPDKEFEKRSDIFFYLKLLRIPDLARNMTFRKGSNYD